MPYKSTAQRGKMHALLNEGKVSPSVVAEFDKASKGLKLPKHVGKAKRGVGAPLGNKNAKGKHGRVKHS